MTQPQPETGQDRAERFTWQAGDLQGPVTDDELAEIAARRDAEQQAARQRLHGTGGGDDGGTT